MQVNKEKGESELKFYSLGVALKLLEMLLLDSPLFRWTVVRMGTLNNPKIRTFYSTAIDQD